MTAEELIAALRMRTDLDLTGVDESTSFVDAGLDSLAVAEITIWSEILLGGKYDDDAVLAIERIGDLLHWCDTS